MPLETEEEIASAVRAFMPMGKAPNAAPTLSTSPAIRPALDQDGNPQPGMTNPMGGAPLGYGRPVSTPNQRTVRAGGSQLFNPGIGTAGGVPSQPARFQAPNTPQTAVPFPSIPSTQFTRTPRGAQKPQPIQPGSFVSSENTPIRVMGGAGAPMHYDDDPMANDRQIVSSAGLSSSEFSQNLLPQHREALANAIMEAGQSPGSQFASVATQLAKIRRAQGEAMSASNMDPDEKAQAGEMLRNMENGLLYGVAQDTSRLLSERHNAFVDGQRMEHRNATEMQGALKEHEGDMAAERKKQVDIATKRAQEELYDPLHPIDPARLRARTAEIIVSEGGSMEGMDGTPGQSAPASNGEPIAIAPGDTLDYRSAEDGSLVAEDDGGVRHAATVHQGRAVIVPQSQEEIDSLPGGTPYLSYGRPNEKGIQQAEVQFAKDRDVDGPKTPTEHESGLAVENGARKIAEDRSKEYETYLDKVRDYNREGKAAVTKKEKAKLVEPDMPALLADAARSAKSVTKTEDKNRAGIERFVLDGVEYDPSKVTERDRADARKKYHEGLGYDEGELSQRQMAAQAAKYQRVHDQRSIFGSMVVMPNGQRSPVERIVVNGKAVYAPVPIDSSTAVSLINSDMPFATRGDGDSLRLARATDLRKIVKDGSKGLPQADAQRLIRNTVDATFPYMPGDQRKDLSMHIYSQMGYQ